MRFASPHLASAVQYIWIALVCFYQGGGVRAVAPIAIFSTFAKRSMTRNGIGDLKVALLHTFHT